MAGKQRKLFWDWRGYDTAPVWCDPSPAEIRRECRKIQAEWSEAERRSRTVQPVPPWEVPRVRENSLLR